MVQEMLYTKRINALRNKMAKQGLDAVWVLEPANRRYLSGFKAIDPQLTESAGSLLITQDEAILITDSRYGTEAKAEAPDFEVKVVKGEAAQVLGSCILETGAKRIGFEEDYVTYQLYKELVEKLDHGSKLFPIQGLIKDMRQIKDPYEIEALKASAEMISSIMGEIIGWLTPGLTEREVAWQIHTLAYRGGAEDLAFPPIVASGPNAALPHAIAGDKKISTDEPIVLDMGVKLNGYCSDISRTVFLSEPSAEFKKIYSVVREAQKEAFEVMRAGLMSDEVDGVARDVIKKRGYGEYFGHALGHGVGLATHEAPRIGPLKPVRLEAGMIVTVEPGIYLPGKGGVRLEEMVLIQETGVELLTKDPNFYQF